MLSSVIHYLSNCFLPVTWHLSLSLQALVVAGGFFWEPYGVLDTTEMLVLSGPGQRSAWTFMDPLPSPR